MILNQYHRIVARWLDEMGIQWTEEYPAAQYSIDLFLNETRQAVELDGPYHNKVKDRIRDENLAKCCGISTVRIKVGTKKREALEAIFGKGYDNV